jgi:Leucine-rich repeat (LRR) protein
MTDQVMMELAKMQSKIRAYEQNEKKNIEQLHLRDNEISELRKKLDLLELKENMIAKNKSYLELKAQKDVDQIKENQKLKTKNK